MARENVFELCISLHSYNLEYYYKVGLWTELLKSSLDNSKSHNFILKFISKFYTNWFILERNWERFIDDPETSNILPTFTEKILEK